ncbi:MAG: valine--tRNA ligase [Chitinophagaceae bacterium]|nr:MAG: valine--tRNA ligase [Chitinophagaceae bacterium]
MALSKNYQPGETESKWYAHWIDQHYFHSVPDKRAPFTIVIPPPNVTGVLHMGHTLNETVQDILIRRARMQGYNTCWVPGSDHASIATEAKVVAMLKERGIKKSDLSREEFLKYAFEWKEKYGGIIYSQIKKLGCSCDWDRVTFTMDGHYYEAVIKTFVELYKKGLIYRGARMIHWDPAAQTALSDEEVDYREVNSKLYYVRYPLEGSNEFITVATTRPETIPGDTAICVNPTDIRYYHLKGKFAYVPVINRRVPVIFDEYVDKEFGTGCLKVTPAHDINDYNLGLKHHLEVIDVFNPDGTMSAAAQIYPGEDRFVVRKKFVQDLKDKGFLVKEENIVNKNGFSQRTNAVVEPRISTQWFLRMNELSKEALDAVLKDDIQFFPEGRFLNTYRYWMENIKDWCISRQLWWGQRIPAWYDEKGNVYVAETEEEAIKQYAVAGISGSPAPPPSEEAGRRLRQDEDVLDTWFSSWLWPMEVFNGISRPENEEIKYYYPTTVLVTGQDIIFFWVARMIMAGMEFKQEKPFRHVYFTGMVRDKQGRKMSKSLGNSPDLLQLIDQYGSDAVRFGIMIASPAGNDLLFDESSLEQGRNFCNKMWNALKLIRMWEVKERPDGNNFAVNWFENRLPEVTSQIQSLFDDYRLSEALKMIYSLIWDDFCSWYLEWIKPSDKQISSAVLSKTITFFEELLQLLHPFMPFVTEEIYHQLKEREPNDDLIVRQFEKASEGINYEILRKGELLRSYITIVRDFRNKNNYKKSDMLQLILPPDLFGDYEGIHSLIEKMVTAELITADEIGSNVISSTSSTTTTTTTIPIEGWATQVISTKKADTSIQKEQLQKDLAYQKDFLASVAKKLANEKFMQHAKAELIERERKKQSDAEERIRAIEESLKVL